MRQRTAVIGWIVLISLPLLTGAAAISIKEPARLQHMQKSWRESLASLAGNRTLRRLLIADLLLGIQVGINSSIFFFLIGQVLAMPEYATFFLVVPIVSGLLSVPIFLRMSYRLGKHRTLAISSLITCVGTLAFFVIPQQSFWLTFFASIPLGITIGSRDFLMRSIMADVIDQDRFATGVDHSALFYSTLALTAKLGLAASVGLIYPVLDWVGFDPAGINDDATLWGVRALAAGSPTLLLFLVCAIMWRFPLDKSSQQELRAGLEAKHNE